MVELINIAHEKHQNNKSTPESESLAGSVRGNFLENAANKIVLFHWSIVVTDPF